MALRHGFKLAEIDATDIDELLMVQDRAMASDEMWQHVFKGVKSKDIIAWNDRDFRPFCAAPYTKILKISEESTGKIVAFAALQIPWSQCEMSDESKAKALSEEFPEPAPGMNEEEMRELIRLFRISNQFDYDPEIDYHRKGLYILPEYQKMGFGSYLSQHLNDIADKSGARCWVPARPASVGLFRKQGFRDVTVHDWHFERYGGTREGSITVLLMREPQK